MFGNPKHNQTFQILDHKRDRAPFHLLVNPSFKTADPARTRLFTHYDLFPTMLSAAGFEIPGHRLGLGVDLFASGPTLIEFYGESYVNALGLQQAGSTYLALWGLAKNAKARQTNVQSNSSPTGGSNESISDAAD
jgi:hypothetical protein